MDKYHSIFIVDDEPWTLVSLREVFDQRALGFRVIDAECDPSAAIQKIENEKPDILVADLMMPDLTGIDMTRYLRGNGLSFELVFVGECAQDEHGQKTAQLGAFEYCRKPVTAVQAEALLLKIRARIGRPASRAAASKEFETDGTHFDHMLNFIETHYNQRLYLKDLARQFYLAPSYCCSLFTKKTGMTFSRYINELRMKKAELLVSNSDLPLLRVATLCGFEDYAYFSRVYKKKFGVTPSDCCRRKRIPSVTQDENA